ncbi:MAG: B-box zinc finger protein [Pyrinomonadaceae bacterium]
MQETDAVISQNSMWQVEVGGQIYEADIQELAQWIDEGALQPQDKVRRGNLRWLEAHKIPALYGFFNAKELGLPAPPAVSVTKAETVQTSENSPPNENFTPSAANNFTVPSNNNARDFQILQTNKPAEKSDAFLTPVENQLNMCSLHPQAEAKFVCTECAKVFCQACPKSYGGSVRLCPACGKMCKAVAEVLWTQGKNFKYQNDLQAGFGFADFGRAIVYPFNFKFSLISGAILFMFFSLGQSAWGMGGIFMIVASIFCAMLANTLTFGVLANTVENFSRGETGKNFMPSFDDFNMWDDVLQPFFLSIASYLVSFGVLLLIVIGGLYFAWNAASTANSSNMTQRTLANINSVQNTNQQTAPDAMTVEEAQASRDADAKRFAQLESQIKQAQAQTAPSADDENVSPNKVFSGFLNTPFFL